MLGTHIRRRANEGGTVDLPGLFFTGSWGHGLSHPKINDLRHWLAVNFRDENVGGFEITMQYRLLMSVMHGEANLLEKGHAFSDR